MTGRTSAPGRSAQVEAMNRLEFMVGRWRGTGWTALEHGTAEFEQEESVRRLLGGEIITVEGRANAPGDHADVRFSAFAIARYDTAAGAFRWRAYSGGDSIEVPLEVGDGTYRWQFEAGPDVLVRFEGALTADTWSGSGFRSTDAGNTWSQTFAMDLGRLAGEEPHRVARPDELRGIHVHRSKT